MKKQTLYTWTACIAAVGIMFSLLVGYYTEEQKNEYVYEKVGEIISRNLFVIKMGETDGQRIYGALL